MTHTNSKISGGWWVIIVGVAFVGALFALKTLSPHARTNLSNRELALLCTSDMATEFHIHPHLAITISGEAQPIPANIGIRSGCMNALHTHDDTGKIHVESPEQRDFTLADFFAVWGKPFDKDHILDQTADDQHRIRETINGNEVLDYENTIVHDSDQIIIYYEEKT